MKKQVCVVGLGTFGSTIARELYQTGHDVLAIDIDEEKIQEMLGQVTYAVWADATNESVLKEFEVSDYDVAVVAMGGNNIQTSILVTALMKGIGVPYVIARSASDIHGSTLERIGADKIIHPEMESGIRAAHIGFDWGALDYMPIVPNFGICKMRPPEAMYHQTLEEAGLCNSSDKYNLSVLAIRRGRTYIMNPADDEEVQPGDVLIVAGTNEHMGELYELAVE